MRDEVKGIITEKCANAHCRVLELDSISQAGTERERGRLWVGPQHISEITNYSDTPGGLLTSYYNTGIYKSK